METAILRIILSMLEFFATTLLHVLKRYGHLTVRFRCFDLAVHSHIESKLIPQLLGITQPSGMYFLVNEFKYFTSCK